MEKTLFQIELEFVIYEVIEVVDRQFLVGLQMEMTASWAEPRIEWVGGENTTIPEQRTLGIEMINNLWLPDIFINKLDRISTNKLFKPFSGLWIFDGRELSYSVDINVYFYCKMRFVNYPLDTQSCDFLAGSYAYNNTMIRIKTVLVEYRADDFVKDLESHVTGVQKLASTQTDEYGDFSMAGFRIMLSRDFSIYIWSYYLPSGLFVSVSWVSFLIPADAIPGRMSLLVTMFLVLVNIFGNLLATQPRSAVTAIAAWFFSCILFVFGSLMAYAGLLFKKVRFVRRTRNWDKSKRSASEKSAKSLLDQEIAQLDWRFLFLFPTLFLIFNVLYWIPVIARRYINH